MGTDYSQKVKELASLMEANRRNFYDNPSGDLGPVNPDPFPNTPAKWGQSSIPDPSLVPDDPGFVDRVLDIISRPRYAVTNVIKDWIDPDPATDNPFESLWAGFSGIDKTSTVDAIDKYGEISGNPAPDWIRGTAGLAGDIAFDPFTYSTFGMAGLAAKGAKAIKGATSGLTKAKEAAAGLEQTPVGTAIPGAGFGEEAFVGPNAAPVSAAGDVVENVGKNATTGKGPTAGDKYGSTRDIASENVLPIDPPDLPKLVEEMNSMPVSDVEKLKSLFKADALGTSAARMRKTRGGGQQEPIWAKPNGLTFNADSLLSKAVKDFTKEQQYKALGPKPGMGVQGKNIDAVEAWTQQAAAIEKGINAAKITDAVANRVDNAPIVLNNEVIGKTHVTAPDNPAGNVAPPVGVESVPKTETTPVFRDIKEQRKTVADVTSKLDSKFKGLNYAGGQLREAKVESFLPILKQLKDINTAKGSYSRLTVGGRPFHLDAYDVYSSVSPKALKDLQFNKYESIPPSAALAGGAKAAETVMANLPPDVAIAQIAKEIMSREHTVTQQVVSARRATKAAKHLYEAGPKIREAMVANEAAYKLRDAASGKAIGEGVAQKVADDFVDPATNTGRDLHNLAEMGKRIQALAKENGLSPGGEAMAADIAARKLPEFSDMDVKNARLYVGIGRDFSNSPMWTYTALRPKAPTPRDSALKIAQEGKAARPAGPPPKPGEIPTPPVNAASLGPQVPKNLARQPNPKPTDAQLKSPQAQSINKHVQEIAHNAVKSMNENLAAKRVSLDISVGTVSEGLFKVFYGGVMRFFNKGFKQLGLDEVWRANSLHYGAIANAKSELAALLKKKYANNPTLINTAALHLAMETPVGTLAPEVAEAVSEMRALVQNVLPTSKGAAAWSDAPMMRMGLTPDTQEFFLREAGIKDFKWTPKKKPTDPEVTDQWRAHLAKVEDPLEFIVRHDMAAQSAASWESVGRHLSEEWGSTIPKEGWVQLKRSSEHDLTHHMDLDRWYSPETIDGIRNFTKEMNKPHSVQSKFMRNTVAPYLNLWKLSATIIRPGHLIRNGMGDTIINTMVRVWNPKWYAKAANVLKAGGAFHGSHEALQRLTTGTMPEFTGDVIQTVTLKGGRTQSMNAHEAYYQIHRQGGVTNYKASNDLLLDDSEGIGKRIAESVNNTKYVKFMGNIAGETQNGARIAQILKTLSDTKFSSQFDTLEDAVSAAVKEAQKYHPDVTGLTNSERRFMRMAIPFYSWFRQTTPMVMKAVMMNPAALTMTPKIGYNLAVGTGNDPQSPQNQFPWDDLFPSYLDSNIMGPAQFGEKDFLFNLGSPVEGVADVFNGKSGEALAGMLNPLIKQPWGVVTGSQPMGHYISDTSEWIDQAIPFGNQIANVFAVSPSGTLESLFNEGKIDWQRANESGEKDVFFNQNMANFLLGLGIENVSRPSYKKQARKELAAERKSRDPYGGQIVDAEILPSRYTDRESGRGG